ncbi:IS66 family insertion sequence element accessory protein TnpB [Turicibacter sp. MMM721]|uniref:IS66 family insertion sequence element accessory protein TnpB n=2 Tax=Turicibacter TaxID=191303 RepID=A0ABY5JMJ3_9FIRM|nr:IS66 family insertion sequence element accessory protein TnpB [Turicibacter bilis]UUF06233.1 IS66 family insertion sequence element accessory protein TnpB [Turicibacter bilis]
MRCGNEGLTNVLTDKYDLDLFNQTIFLFCGRKKIETKLYTRIVTDLCCYI